MVSHLLKRWCHAAIPGVLASGLLLCLFLAESSSPAREEKKTEALPADLAKVPGDAMFVFSVRVADLWGSAFAKPARELMAREKDADLDQEFAKRFGLSLGQVERLTVVFQDMIGPQNPLFFVRTARPYEAAKITGGEKMKKTYKGQSLYRRNEEVIVYPLDDRSLVYGTEGSLHTLIDHPAPKDGGEMAAAPRLAVGRHSLVFGLNVKAFNEAVGDKLPGEAEPFKPLLQARVGTLAVDLGPESRADLKLTFASEADAKAGVKPLQTGQALAVMGLDRGIAELAKEKEAARIVELLKKVQGALKMAKVEQDDKTLRASTGLKLDVESTSAVVLEAIQKMRAAASRAQATNNLKQIGVAMHNYHSTYNRFPPQATYDKNGKPLLSWRVMILPFIDQQNLYHQFHLDEPWDSEHNKKLLEKMPKTYASPSDEKTITNHVTHYQGFFGKGAFFEGKKGIQIVQDIPDGTSNTLMIVEASKAVPWSKPEDLSYDAAKPVPKLGLPGAKGFLASLCDGSVRMVSHSITEKTLRDVITRNDGNPIGPDF